MSLTASTKSLPFPGGVRASVTKVTFDSSYPTGGEALAASDVGLPFISFAICQPRAAGYVVQYDAANKKLVAYRTAAVTVAGGAAAASTDALSVKSNVLNKESAGSATVIAQAALAEVANTTDLQTLVVDVLAFYVEGGTP